MMNDMYKVIIALLTSLIFAQNVNVELEMVQLSHIGSDRAAGILKALGYSVTDYKSRKGTNKNELVLSPSSQYIKNGISTNPNDLPVIIVMPETENITLLEMESEASKSGDKMSVDMGGVSLVYTTTNEPLQRLMVAYNPNDMESLFRVLDLIKNKIDKQAKQVVIDALVLEIDSEKVSELGVKYSAKTSPLELEFSQNDNPKGTFTMAYDKTLLGDKIDFDTKLEALISSQEATILSRPSVIVLDGRQARIVVGQQIPVSETAVSENFATTKVKYIQVGIVLNLRPRVSDDNRFVSMQIEAIISEAEERLGSGTTSGVLSAPTINSRKVQTYVNVPDDTPFIIGGLISSKKSNQRGGIPILSDIPILGSLFRFKINKEEKKEVIVLITPNLVDVEDNNFTKVIPKDSDRFQQFGSELFQNTYRIQDRDVYDLDFIYESEIYKDIVSKINQTRLNYIDAKEDDLFNFILSGHLPGEEILIRKMLWEVVRSVDFHQHVDNKKIFYFVKQGEFIDVKSFFNEYESFLKNNKDGSKAFKLLFKQDFNSSSDEKYIKRPTAIGGIIDNPKDYKSTLSSLNESKGESTILIDGSRYEKYLYQTLVVEKIVEMNPGILDNIADYNAGLQIVFPSAEIIQKESFILDEKVARHLYENINYNKAFDLKFIEGIEKINDRINSYK
tara:strand:- start:43176 stop:45203 length:2028 start_codon:yes stop_codon:yes gene_type:complete